METSSINWWHLVIKSYIIILQNNGHSCRIGHESILAAEQFGIFPEIHPGVNGFDSYRYFKEYNITRFLCRTIIDLPGHQGCFLSHFQLWKKCTELNLPILILEHDGVFIRPLPDNILNNFDDILYLDTFSPYDIDSKNNYINEVNESLNHEINYWNRPGHYWHAVGEHLSGAYGYIIKPTGAQKLIDFAINIGAAPTDIHIGRQVVDIKSTTCTIVKMHDFYTVNGVKENSSTEDLSKFLSGANQMSAAEYLTPKKYKKLFLPK